LLYSGDDPRVLYFYQLGTGSRAAYAIVLAAARGTRSGFGV
jgi:hypothetical protein